jgi:hypothetical protein
MRAFFPKVNKLQTATLGETTYGDLRIHDAFGLCDADEKRPEENVPEVEAELVPDVGHNVADAILLIRALLVLPDTQGAILIGIGGTDADGDGEDGDIHHGQEAELDRRVHSGQVQGRGIGVPGRSCLEEGGQDPGPHGEVVDRRILQVQGDDQHDVDKG